MRPRSTCQAGFELLGRGATRMGRWTSRTFMTSSIAGASRLGCPTTVTATGSSLSEISRVRWLVGERLAHEDFCYLYYHPGSRRCGGGLAQPDSTPATAFYAVSVQVTGTSKPVFIRQPPLLSRLYSLLVRFRKCRSPYAPILSNSR